MGRFTPSSPRVSKVACRRFVYWRFCRESGPPSRATTVGRVQLRPHPCKRIGSLRRSRTVQIAQGRTTHHSSRYHHASRLQLPPNLEEYGGVTFEGPPSLLFPCLRI